jgi:carboxypeptidase family protein
MRATRQRVALCVGLIALFETTAAIAQVPLRTVGAAKATANQRYRYRILGAFDDATGDPIADVEVTDLVTGSSARTTETGTVSLLFLPDGGSLVRLRRLGYETQTLLVTIAPADTAPLTVTLHSAAQLPAVIVNDKAPAFAAARLRDADARMKSHSGGYFLDEAMLRKSDNSTLATTILSHMPGLMPTTGPHGEMFLVSARATCTRAFSCVRQNCYPKVLIDGVQFLDPTQLGSLRLDFSRLSPRDYAIIEFYPGGATVPPGFDASTCGVLLLWSRER